VGNAELLEQRLGLEVSNPDRGDLSVSDGPTVDDLDHRIGASHTLVDDRVDTAVRGDNTDVAEPREIEHVGKTGKDLVAKEHRTGVRASPREIVGCGPGEVGIQILREVGQSTLDAQLIECVHHRLVALVFGPERQPCLLRVTPLTFAVSRQSCRRQPQESGRSRRTPCRRRGRRSRGRSPPVRRRAPAAHLIPVLPSSPAFR
jgi:hypothetical protein